MNGFITKNTLRLCFSAASLVSLIGCYHYRELVDPCWPERYNAIARQSVRDMHNIQADKGHLLDQTIWNWQFEPEKNGAAGDKLNGAGMEVLRRISRTLPAPDMHLFVQNAQDIPYVDGVPPDKIINQREHLNRRRIDSILRFLATQPSAGGSASYQVAVHDFAPPGLPGYQTVIAVERNDLNIKGGIPQPFVSPTYSTK